MKNYKLIRNIWLITGCIWLITLTLNAANNGWLILIILNLLVVILSFVMVHIYDGKVKKAA